MKQIISKNVDGVVPKIQRRHRNFPNSLQNDLIFLEGKSKILVNIMID